MVLINSLQKNYWDNFQVEEDDIEFLYNFLLELETPQTPQELTRALVRERIRIEKQKLEGLKSSQGDVYLPSNHYEVNQNIIFPNRNFQTGIVNNVRSGNNPDIGDFEVIEVKFDDGQVKSFAASLQNHKLNQASSLSFSDPLLDYENVMRNYGRSLMSNVSTKLEDNPGLVRIAGRWFPRALLVDVNIGHLNLAEALLEMNEGGPLTTPEILEQIELPTDSNLKLTEFSLNLALEEDGRFDEVGPIGETLWYLCRLEPDWVQNVPPFLRFQPVQYNQEIVTKDLELLSSQIFDEFEPGPELHDPIDQISITLNYAHWRSGTLPLTNRVKALFPSAIETPRVRFTFVDKETGDKFPGWVVRPSRYVLGLKDWYQNLGIFPGNTVTIQRSQVSGEFTISLDHNRLAREWVRTAQVTSDGQLNFSMSKQAIRGPFDERQIIALPNPAVVDTLWEQSSRHRGTLDHTIAVMMREQTKLSPQGHVHFVELYAAVNVIRRCPPGPLLSILFERPWASYLGDFYFRLDETKLEGRNG
jgi:hypothetical protein